jgi:hypothetical protein
MAKNGPMKSARLCVDPSNALGFGRVIQTRAEEVIFGDVHFGDSGLPAVQGTANAPAVGVLNTSTAAPNVIVNGWNTKNNKGMVVEQWEPYYDQGWDFAPPTVAQYGQKVVMFYDSVGRAVRTLNPDGTEQRVLTGIPGISVISVIGGMPVLSSTQENPVKRRSL